MGRTAIGRVGLAGAREVKKGNGIVERTGVVKVKQGQVLENPEAGKEVDQTEEGQQHGKGEVAEGGEVEITNDLEERGGEVMGNDNEAKDNHATVRDDHVSVTSNNGREDEDDVGKTDTNGRKQEGNDGNNDHTTKEEVSSSKIITERNGSTVHEVTKDVENEDDGLSERPETKEESLDDIPDLE